MLQLGAEKGTTLLTARSVRRSDWEWRQRQMMLAEKLYQLPLESSLDLDAVR